MSVVLRKRERRADLSTAEVKKKCPWYFTLKGLISERPNAVPVGLGNNTTEYDTSILLPQDNNEVGPSTMGDDPLDSDELKDTAEDQELEHDLKSFNKDAIGAPSPDTKGAAGGTKATTKKEATTPAKRTRSQVDRIADTEIARFECKKVKFETEQQRLKTVESVASVRAQEKTRRAVEVRQAELDAQKELMRMNYEYRLEMLKLGHVPPPSSQGPQPLTLLHDFQPYPDTWHSSTSSPGFQPHPTPQPPAPFQVPPLESFPLPSSPGYVDSDHHNSPGPSD